MNMIVLADLCDPFLPMKGSELWYSLLYLYCLLLKISYGSHTYHATSGIVLVNMFR